MSGAAWGKFFWSDYASDPALKLCSFAAQGLWMRMLCIAAEHDGFVAVNGRGLDSTGIARMTGGAVGEVEALLTELDANGVYSRDRRGWIYSRRMIVDAKRRREASEHGKKGGNPSLRKDLEKTETPKGVDKGKAKGETKPQKPEARSSVDKSTGGEPPDDPVKELFDMGVAMLVSQDHDAREARSIIGRWRKRHDDGEIVAALIDARTRAISNLVEWMPKRLSGKRSTGPPSFLDHLIEQRERATG